MTAIRTIHACRRAAGLDEDAARDVYQRVSGKRSLKLMNTAEQNAVAKEFRRLAGPKRDAARRPDGRLKLTGKYAPKLQALWIAAWNLGLIRNRDDAALVTFVKRQCKVDHVRFVTEPEDAAKAIEALKAWMAREAGVDWKNKAAYPPYAKLSGHKIACAQWRIAGPDAMPAMHRFQFGNFVFQITGQRMEALVRERDWQPVMNALGKQVRAMKEDDHD